MIFTTRPQSGPARRAWSIFPLVIGDLLELRFVQEHEGNADGRYEHEAGSLLEPGVKRTRLTRIALGNGFNHFECYGYAENGNDSAGCMTAINGIQMAWDHEQQLHKVGLGQRARCVRTRPARMAYLRFGFSEPY